MIRSFLTLLFVVLATAMRADTGYINLSDGGELYYETYGKGTPVILVHGHTLDRRMWRPQIEALSKHFLVITPDMRGYGRSSRMYDGIKTTHVDDLIEFMDSLHIDKAHIVGLSMGGFITADMVCMYPERMISATMASGSLRNMKGPSSPMDSTEIAKQKAAIHEVLIKGITNWRNEWVDKLVKGGGSNAESIREALFEQVNDWDGYQLLHVEPRLYYAQDAVEPLKAKCPKLPVLFLSGENEHKKPSSMMKSLPNSKFVVLKDCGHMSNMEQPEQFNKALLDFLLGQ